jgi:hypothetical protein
MVQDLPSAADSTGQEIPALTTPKNSLFGDKSHSYD